MKKHTENLCVIYVMNVDRSRKHTGMTYYCRITGNDVGQSQFGGIV